MTLKTLAVPRYLVLLAFVIGIVDTLNSAVGSNAKAKDFTKEKGINLYRNDSKGELSFVTVDHLYS
jgi:hypothetical protein